MSPTLKIIIGLVLILIGLGFFVDSVSPFIPLIGKEGRWHIDWLGNFIVVVTGAIPPFIILIGLFVVWLELDELKMQRELQEEEEKEKKKKGKKDEEKEE